MKLKPLNSLPLIRPATNRSTETRGQQLGEQLSQQLIYLPACRSRAGGKSQLISGNLPCTVSLAETLSREPTMFCAIHWYRPSSVGRTSLISRFPPSTIRTRASSLFDRKSSRSSMISSLRQLMVGSGFPLGGPHSSRAVSPAATRVSLGSTRNSSRRTGKRYEGWGKWVKVCTAYLIFFSVLEIKV